MRTKKCLVVNLAVICLFAVVTPSGWAKKKHKTINPNDPTYKVYQVLNDKYGGKLTNFYLLADLYTDPQNPSTKLRRVLRVDYDKNRFFGRFRIYIRSVGKMTPAQLKTYNVKQIYDFGESDDSEFEKINPGPLGGTGDLYLKATSNGPLAPAPITDQLRQEYDMLITKYILPGLEKK